jgi:hypothetical protein
MQEDWIFWNINRSGSGTFTSQRITDTRTAPSGRTAACDRPPDAPDKDWDARRKLTATHTFTAGPVSYVAEKTMGGSTSDCRRWFALPFKHGDQPPTQKMVLVDENGDPKNGQP